jgi:hypothetical protein
MIEAKEADKAWMTLVNHFKDRAHTSEGLFDAALSALGDCLYFLADLDPDDRCMAIDEALCFYNNHRPEATVAPTDGPKFKIVHPPLLPIETS